MDQSGAGPKCGWQGRTRRCAGAAIVWLLVLLVGTERPVADAEPLPLQLEVFINGRASNLIAGFRLRPDGRLEIERNELVEIGIAAPDDDRGVIRLDQLDGVTYRYDDQAQSIYFELSASKLQPHTFDVRKADGEQLDAAPASFGGVLNYGLVASAASYDDFSGVAFDGLSANLSGRLFGPLGTLAASGVVGDIGSTISGRQGAGSFLRLDTTWSYSDPATLTAWRAGDVVSGGLSWTRPIRLGGVQRARNFALRPDLVTLPLPSLAGTAAVPSTIDVYIDQTRTFSQQIPAGPFTVSNIPAVSGAGKARLVVREAGGRVSETSAPFYSTDQLLRAGLMDYSAEAGFARRGHGTTSADYDQNPLVSASLRYGWSDRLTFEGHAEAGAGLANGGAGAVFGLGEYGVMSLGATASVHSDGWGAQVHGAIETEVHDVSLSASARQTFGDYLDLAAVTSELDSVASPERHLFAGAPLKSLARVSIGFGLDFLDAGVSATFLHAREADGETADIATLSLSKRLSDRISVYANGFHDFSDDGNSGAFAGLSISLGGRDHASLGVSSDRDGTNYSADYTRQLKPEPGSVGWRVREGEGSARVRQASLAYYGSMARFQTSVHQNTAGFSATTTIDGAVATAGGDVFLAPRIDDAFAIVDAGAPDVEIRFENRAVGRTGSDGRLLVPGLRSYQKNKIAIDPVNLPVNAAVATVQKDIVPADGNGVKVKFEIDRLDHAALVRFRLADGTDVPVGSSATLEATGEEFVIGYGGEGYIRGLAKSNTVTINLGDTTCRAEFGFRPEAGSQVVIEGVPCQ